MRTYNYINKYLKLNTDDEAVVKFGLEMMIELIIAIIVVSVVSIVFGMIMESIVFLLFLIPLRQNAGGYHTKSQISCGILSLIILIGVLVIINKYNVSRELQLFLCFVNSCIICLFAPVDNSNNKLDDFEKKVYANRTKKILLFELLIFILLFICQYSYWSAIIAIAIAITGALVLIGFIQNKRGDNV